jgi:hypothetical protein
MNFNISNVIYENKYYQIAKQQQGRLVSRDYEKKCNLCKETKNQAEFDLRFSNKFQMYCLYYICKECRIIKNTEYYKNRYTTDTEYRNRAIQRAKEYRNKNKY